MVFQLSDFIPLIRKSEIMGIPLLLTGLSTCLIMVLSTMLTGSGWFILDALIVLSILSVYGVKPSYNSVIGLFFLVTFVFLISYSKPLFQSFSSSVLPVYETEMYSKEIYVSRMAVRDGGILGLGLGRGISKLGLLSNPEGEFILTTLLEETGIVGFIPYVISLFAVYFIGIRTVNRSRRKEDVYVASSVMGIIVLIVFSSVSCMMRTVGMNPFGGVLLPFFSFNPVYEGIFIAILCILYKYIYMMGRSQKHEK
ncbi:MAG: FtsW/RodA/SpoVE family cell cycle protein [Spirochaetales bacterium]|nr:FtsW/RodA/SpoVE family cell cycle protein [Candidatus Physcosoma equi]